MGSPRQAKPQKYRCVNEKCGKEGVGEYLPGLWWSYPSGWFLMETETESLLACSVACAREVDP